MGRSSLLSAGQDIKQSSIGLRRNGVPTAWYTMGAVMLGWFRIFSVPLAQKIYAPSYATAEPAHISPRSIASVLSILNLSYFVWHTYSEEHRAHRLAFLATTYSAHVVTARASCPLGVTEDGVLCFYIFKNVRNPSWSISPPPVHVPHSIRIQIHENTLWRLLPLRPVHISYSTPMKKRDESSVDHTSSFSACPLSFLFFEVDQQSLWGIPFQYMFLIHFVYKVDEASFWSLSPSTHSLLDSYS